jgi:diguanylate cyclase (GGDEF)-like protein/PAS domain S-box-containing protein
MKDKKKNKEFLQLEIRTAAEKMVIKQLHQEIELRKKAERVTQDARHYAESIVDTVREPLLVLDADLKVISASRSFYQSFKVKREETERHHIYDLGNRQWAIPKLRELLEDILPKTSSFNNLEVEHDFPGIGKRIMLLNARKIYRKTNRTQNILLAIEDITERKELEERLKTLASHDELTGCVNFKSTMELLEKEIVRSRRYQKQFCVVMIDIDNFKSTNDKYGHQVGNDVLAAFAAVIKNSLRSIDCVGRYGGEEFIVIIPEADAPQALAVLERIRNNLEQTKITSPHMDKAQEVTLKYSAGIAAFPYNAKDLKELIWAADNALLQAKKEGKNRAVLERRKMIRLGPKPGTRINIVDSSGKENVGALQIADISKEGMLFLSTQDILGEEFLCHIYRPKDESPFELTCKVKHKGKPESELYRVGVYFPDIPESSKKKLSECIESPK